MRFETRDILLRTRSLGAEKGRRAERRWQESEHLEGRGRSKALKTSM